jgi:hypothetical protein
MIDYKKKYLKYKLKYLNLKKNPKKNKLGFLKGGTIEELQAYLDSKNLNLKVHNVSDDGNCLFHAIIHQLELYPETKHHNLDNLRLREETVNWLKKNPNYKLPDDGGPGERVTIKQALLFDFGLLDDMKIDYDTMESDNIWNEYIEKLGQVGCWGDTHTINAVCMMLQININVYVDNNNGDRIFKLNDEWSTIKIGYVNKNHFVSLVSTKDTIKDEESEDEKTKKALEEIKSYQPSKTADVSTEDNDSENNKSFAKTIAISALIVSLLLIFLNQ